MVPKRRGCVSWHAGPRGKAPGSFRGWKEQRGNTDPAFLVVFMGEAGYVP